MDEFPVYWLAELDEQLHECHVPEPRRGRIHSCECGCIWEALGLGNRLRWALIRDPDKRDRKAGT
jgi:hypothetical protein